MSGPPIILLDNGSRRARTGTFLAAGQALLVLVLLWLTFYCLGQALLLLPTPFHEGTLWRPPL